MKKPCLALSFALIGGAAHALTLTTPFDVGLNLTSSTSPNGDSYTRNTPVLIAPGAPILSDLAEGLNTYYSGVSTPPTVTIGAGIAGVASVRKQDAWLPQQGNGRYFSGSLFQIDYNAPDDPDLRWLVAYSFFPQGDPPYAGALLTSGFQDEQPFFYTEATDPSQRENGSYRLDSGVASLSAPGIYDWNLYATLASVSRDGTGTVTGITIHDGVRLSGTAVLVNPVPEPASLAVLGLGLAALLRRRRRA